MEYQIGDLYVAAAVKVALNLSAPEIIPGGRFSTFIFQVDPVKAEKIVSDFYSDLLVIPARRYSQDVRDLKVLIHQAREAHGR